MQNLRLVFTLLINLRLTGSGINRHGARAGRHFFRRCGSLIGDSLRKWGFLLATGSIHESGGHSSIVYLRLLSLKQVLADFARSTSSISDYRMMNDGMVERQSPRTVAATRAGCLGHS